jgi:hypothetical protein
MCAEWATNCLDHTRGQQVVEPIADLVSGIVPIAPPAAAAPDEPPVEVEESAPSNVAVRMTYESDDASSGKLFE